MKKLHILLAVLLTVFLVGCDQPRHVRKHHKEKVKTYRVHQSDDTWVYWYIINDLHTHNYYYASSPTQLTSYSSVGWTRSATAPQLNEAEPLGEVDVHTSELGQAGVEIAQDYGVPDINSLDSLEGVPDVSFDIETIDVTPDTGGGFDTTPDTGGGDPGGGGGPD